MSPFRIPRDPTFSLNLSWAENPVLWVVLFFFTTSSMDMLNVPLAAFAVKLTNLAAFFLLSFLWLCFRSLWLDRNLFTLTLLLLVSMTLSALLSQFPAYCFSLLVFFAFNYLCYFLVPYNLFRKFSPTLILKIYGYSFYLIGSYGLCQLLFSFAGVFLPGVKQFIFTLARAQAFAYEPSYYALYMTPFTFYSTAKYLLTPPAQRKFSAVFWPNIFLLASTSTGCFFSYLFFLAVLFLFQQLKILSLNLKQIFFKGCTTFLMIFSVLWFTNPKLITKGFLKFFYGRDLFSLFERWQGIVNYWNLFLEHPFFGVGLGAGPFYLAQKIGMPTEILDLNLVRHLYSPMNVTTEVLSGLGLAGGILFLCFFLFLIHTFRSGIKIAHLTEEERTILISLAVSLCVMFMTWQMNQSIMRAYLWIHIGVFCGYARSLQTKYLFGAAPRLDPLPAAIPPFYSQKGHPLSPRSAYLPTQSSQSPFSRR